MNGLKIDSLSGGYRSKRIVHEVSTSLITNGSVVSLLGANGAGKSTLLKTIVGILETQGGSVHLNGLNILEIPLQKRVELIAYMEQDNSGSSSLLAYESVLTTLRIHGSFSNNVADARVQAVFDQLEISHLAMKPMSQMSGGQRQMIGFAHVLVRNPSLMLLDEPTSALDLKKQVEVMQHVRQNVKNNNSIAVVIVHDLNLAMRYSDHLIVMGKGGTLLKEGVPGEVMDSTLLEDAYGVKGRVERCSEGYFQVIVDETVN